MTTKSESPEHQSGFCYAEGDEGAKYCGDPKSLHCAVLGDAAFWESAEGQQHLVKCMRDDHFIHHTFIASPPTAVSQLSKEAADGFRAGVEAAAKIVDICNCGSGPEFRSVNMRHHAFTCSKHLATMVRALLPIGYQSTDESAVWDKAIAIAKNPRLKNGLWSTEQDKAAESIQERVAHALECAKRGENYRESLTGYGGEYVRGVEDAAKVATDEAADSQRMMREVNNKALPQTYNTLLAESAMANSIAAKVRALIPTDTDVPE